VIGSKKTGFGGSEVALKIACCVAGVRSNVPLPLHMHAAVFATGQWIFVSGALRNTVPSVSEPLLQLVNVAFRFLCNVK